MDSKSNEEETLWSTPLSVYYGQTIDPDVSNRSISVLNVGSAVSHNVGNFFFHTQSRTVIGSVDATALADPLAIRTPPME